MQNIVRILLPDVSKQWIKLELWSASTYDRVCFDNRHVSITNRHDNYLLCNKRGDA